MDPKEEVKGAPSSSNHIENHGVIPEGPREHWILWLFPKTEKA